MNLSQLIHYGEYLLLGAFLFAAVFVALSYLLGSRYRKAVCGRRRIPDAAAEAAQLIRLRNLL